MPGLSFCGSMYNEHMIRWLIRVFAILLILAASAFAWSLYENPSPPPVVTGIAQYIRQTFTGAPCEKPIEYSVGAFDTKFGITKDSFKSAIAEAAAIWEAPLGKKLFEYSDTGPLKVNLVYDTRQETILTLKKLGIEIDESKATYDAVKAKYDELRKAYDEGVADLEPVQASFDIRKNAYESAVDYWNRNGGASRDEVARLNAEQEALNALVAEINAKVAAVNALRDEVNATVDVMNSLVSQLNLTVGTYNRVGGQNGREFEQGLYSSDGAKTEIDIYAFQNRAKLVRVLAHELGHALGLSHLDDPTAIMYRLNQATNKTLAPADITALKTLCGVR